MTKDSNSNRPVNQHWRQITGARFATLEVLLLIFAGLSVIAAGPGVLDVDVRFARWLQDAPIPAATPLARFGSWVGAFAVLAPLTLLVLVLLLWRRWRWDALFLAISGVLHGTNSLLKTLIDSPRPTANFVEITANANGNGFPSGHATGSMLIFGALAIITARRVQTNWVRQCVVAVCVALIIIIGFARIKQGVHWPSDVLGGYTWGLAMLLLASIATRFIINRRSQ